MHSTRLIGKLTTRLTGLAAAAVLAAACGGDVDVAGIYEVSRHTINADGCDAEGDPVDQFPFFRLRADAFFGQEFFAFGECQSADDASCDDFGLLSAFLDIDGELVNQVSSSSGGGASPCSLGLFLAVLTDDGGGQLTIETRTFGEVDDTLSADECAPDEAEARGDSMPCEQLEVLVGARVE